MSGGRVLLLGNGPSLEPLWKKVLDGYEFTVPTIGMNRTIHCDHYVHLTQPRYWTLIERGEVTAHTIWTMSSPGEIGWHIREHLDIEDRHEVRHIKRRRPTRFPGDMAAPGDLFDRGTPVRMTGQLAIEVALALGYKTLYLIGYDLGKNEGHAFAGEHDDHATDELRTLQHDIMRGVMDGIAKGWPDVEVVNLGEYTSIAHITPTDPSRWVEVVEGG